MKADSNTVCGGISSHHQCRHRAKGLESYGLKRSGRLEEKYTLRTIDAQAPLIYSLVQPQREGLKAGVGLEPSRLLPALAS